MRRRKSVLGPVLLGLALLLPSVCRAQVPAQPNGAGWTKIPAVLVLAAEGDARLPLVRDAVDFWNRSLAEIGSGFRLGPMTQMAGSIPADEIRAMSDKVLSGSGPPPFPANLGAVPGDMIVVLATANFISFASRWPGLGKALVAIKSAQTYPLSLPNVARNVI